MDLDRLTLGEIKELKLLFATAVDAPKSTVEHGLQIVALQRGWIIVGWLSQNGSSMTLKNASVVERWGTKEGIGELAAKGPLAETRLRKCPAEVRYHELTEVVRIKCIESAWNGYGK